MTLLQFVECIENNLCKTSINISIEFLYTLTDESFIIFCIFNI